MSTTTRPAGRRTRRLAVGTATAALLLTAVTGAAYGVLELGPGRASDSASPTRTAPSPVSAADPSSGIPNPTTEPTPEPSPDPTPDLSHSPSESAEPTRRVQPEPEPVLEPGDRGVGVRELQARLAQLDWYGAVTSPAYGPETTTAVRGFQDRRGFVATGVVDVRTWQRLVGMTVLPTRAELFNAPGPTLHGAGASGLEVRELQARLRQIAWFFGDVTGDYGDSTVEAVSGFQAKRGIPATGAVDQRTLDLLEAMTTEPTADDLANRKPKPKPEPEPKPEPQPDPVEGAALDPRCLSGLVLCVDKTSQSLRWVVDGQVRVDVDVRFGSDELPTREGEFSVFHKSRDHVSSLYDTPMPFAMFFSGGQAVHYSPDFAANGYTGASHGCVNVRDYEAVSALFDQVPIGTKVVVYWS